MGSSNLGGLAIMNPVGHQLNLFLRLRLSAFDAVDGSSTGT